MDSTSTVVDSPRTANNGPVYPSLWQNQEDLVRIGLAAIAAIGMFAALITSSGAYFFAYATLEICIIWRIKDVYYKNIARTEYEYSQTLDLEQAKPWLKKAAEHQYPVAMREYAMITGNMKLLQEAAYLGDTKALSICVMTEKLELKLVTLEAKLRFVLALRDSEIFNEEYKAKRVVEHVNETFGINPLQPGTFKEPVEKMINNFKFSPPVQQKVIAAIETRQPYAK